MKEPVTKPAAKQASKSKAVYPAQGKPKAAPPLAAATGTRKLSDPRTTVQTIATVMKNPAALEAFKKAVTDQRHQAQAVTATGISDAMPVVEARARFGELVSHVQHTGRRVTITKNGKPAAIVVSIDDWEILLNFMNDIDNAIADSVVEDLHISPKPYVRRRDRK